MSARSPYTFAHILPIFLLRMVSLRKYLEMAIPRTMPGAIVVSDEPPPSAATDLLFRELCRRIICSLIEFTRVDGVTPQKADLETDHAAVNSDSIDAATVDRIARDVENALESRKVRHRECAERIANETSEVVEVLNEALMRLAAGNQRVASRFERIQDSLDRTSRVRDMDGLRDSLAEAMKLIRQEAEREQEHAARDLAAFESRVVGVRRQLTENPARQSLDRPQAIERIFELLRKADAGSKLLSAAFRVPNGEALVQRYGREAVDDLFLHIAQSMTQSVSPSAFCCRWSSNCLVAVYQSDEDIAALQARLAEFVRRPVAHRISIGSRTALLKVVLNQLIMQIPPSGTDGAFAEIDRFSGLEVACASNPD